MNTITTFSSHDFNLDSSGAKKAARNGPAFIMDRGQLAHVLLSISDYREIIGKGKTLLEAVVQAQADEIDLDPPRVEGLFKAVDLD